MVPIIVRRKERDYILRRRAAVLNDELPSSEKSQTTQQDSEINEKLATPLVGIALSGGGIRSATFCLGVLQKLASAKLLKLADYMCSVSGGGYIGSCLSSLLTINGQDDDECEPTTGQWDKKADFDVGDNMPLSGNSPDQIHHLRTHGDFLILRDGFFRRDVLRAIGTGILSLISSLALFASVLVVLICLFFVLSWVLAGYGAWQTVVQHAFFDTENGWYPFLSDLFVKLQVEVVLITAALGILSVAITRGLWWKRWKAVDPAGGVNPEELQERALLIAQFWLMLILLAVAVCVVTVTRNTILLEDVDARSVWYAWPNDYPQGLLLPFVFFAGALVASLILGAGEARFDSSWDHRSRSVSAAIIGMSFYGLTISIAFVVTFFIFWWISPIKFDLSAWAGGGGTAVVAMWISRFLARRPDSKSSQKSIKSIIMQQLKKWSLAITVFTIVAASSLLIAKGILGENEGNLNLRVLWVGLTGVLVFFVLGIGIDFNRISLHYFYRDRLAEAYLRTEVRRGGCLTIARDDSDMRLCELHDRFDLGDAQSRPNMSPYHLIECALNLAGSRDLARKDIKSDVFVFSKYFCGSTTTGYVPTSVYDKGRVRVATAITTSGAAASSAIGFLTSFPQAFATTLFNIRLGMWFPNPRSYVHDTSYPTIEDSANDDNAQNRTAQPPPRDIPRRRFGWAFWPRYVFRELTAATTATTPWVNISDGAHTGDNPALYPLLQRRCRLIIACDAGNDPEYSFTALSNVIRQINVDENVLVEVDIDDIRPAMNDESLDDHGRRPTKSHFLIGKITYPPVPETKRLEMPDADDASDSDLLSKELSSDYMTDSKGNPAEDRTGWLIYLKASLTNTAEPASVKAYAAKNADFPHQTTADQFFEDDQFEAYRALGFHIAATMVDALGIKPSDLNATELAEFCKTRWNEGKPQVVAALRNSKGNKTQAAKSLGMEKVTHLTELINRYEIDVKDFKPKSSK